MVRFGEELETRGIKDLKAISTELETVYRREWDSAFAMQTMSRNLIADFGQGKGLQALMPLKINSYLSTTYPDLYTNGQISGNISSVLYSDIMKLGAINKDIVMEVVKLGNPHETIKSGRNPQVEQILMKYQDAMKPYLDNQKETAAENNEWVKEYQEGLKRKNSESLNN